MAGDGVWPMKRADVTRDREEKRGCRSYKGVVKVKSEVVQRENCRHSSSAKIRTPSVPVVRMGGKQTIW